jgi:hypothetical protein
LAPEASVFSVVYDPTDSSIVYLADRGSGVYLSTNGGETWQPLNEGLTHRTALKLAISSDGTVLYASIEGAGVYRLGTPPPVQGADDLVSASVSTGEIQNETDDAERAEAERDQVKSEAESRGLPISCPFATMPAILVVSLLWLHRRRSERI